MQKTFGFEKIKDYIPTALLLCGYVFSLGIGWGQVRANSKEVQELKKDFVDLKRIISDQAKILNEQHTTQEVQANQMKWLIEHFRKDSNL